MTDTNSSRDLDWGDSIYFGDDGDPISPRARQLSGLPPLDPPPGKRWVDVLDEDLDYRTLVDAYFEREEHGNSNVGEYWRRKVAMLEESLGVSLDPARVPPGFAERCASVVREPWDPVHPSKFEGVETPPDRIACELCEDALLAIGMHRAISMPSSYVRYEGLPPPTVRGLQVRHRRRFRALDEGLRRVCREFVADVLRTLDPIVVDRRVRRTQLFDRGLPWWPPEDDPF